LGSGAPTAAVSSKAVGRDGTRSAVRGAALGSGAPAAAVSSKVVDAVARDLFWLDYAQVGYDEGSSEVEVNRGGHPTFPRRSNWVAHDGGGLQTGPASCMTDNGSGAAERRKTGRRVAYLTASGSLWAAWCKDKSADAASGRSIYVCGGALAADVLSKAAGRDDQGAVRVIKQRGPWAPNCYKIYLWTGQDRSRRVASMILGRSSRRWRHLRHIVGTNRCEWKTGLWRGSNTQ